MHRPIRFQAARYSAEPHAVPIRHVQRLCRGAQILIALLACTICAAPNPDPFPVIKSKKGLQIQIVEDAIELGVKHAGLNWNLAQMIDLSKNTNSFRLGDYY